MIFLFHRVGYVIVPMGSPYALPILQSYRPSWQAPRSCVFAIVSIHFFRCSLDGGLRKVTEKNVCHDDDDDDHYHHIQYILLLNHCIYSRYYPLFSIGGLKKPHQAGSTPWVLHSQPFRRPRVMILNANEDPPKQKLLVKKSKKNTRIYKTTVNNGIKLQISTQDFSNRQVFAQYEWTRFEIMSRFCIFPISI